MQLPWPEWGETDFLLTQAQRLRDELAAADACPCGCGLPLSVSSAPENDGMFVVEQGARCFAREAIAAWEAEHGRPEPGWLHTVKLRASVVVAPAQR